MILVSGLLFAGLTLAFVVAFVVSRRSYERRLLQASRAERGARTRSELLARNAAQLANAATAEDVAEHTADNLVGAGVDAAAIYLRDGERLRLLTEAGGGSGEVPGIPAEGWAEPAAREAVDSGELVEQELRSRRTEASGGDAGVATGVVTVLAVPVRDPGGVAATGAVVVASSASKHAFGSTRLVVTGVAEQCSVALERARLDAIRRAARRRAATLLALGTRLAQAVVPAEVADCAVASLSDALEPDLAIAGVASAGGLEVRAVRSGAAAGPTAAGGLRRTLAHAAATAASYAPVEVHGAAQIAEALGPEVASELEREGVRSLLLTPLRHRSGFLGVAFRRSRVPGAGERELLDEMCDRVAEAVERTSLFERERDARRRAEKLETSASFVSALSERLERAITTAERASCLTGLLAESVASFAAVHLVEGVSERLVAQSGRAPQQDDEGRWAAGVRTAIATGRAQVLETPVDEAGSIRPLVLPLGARGRSIGTLTLWMPAEPSADLHPPGLAEEIAARAAILLDNALLYERERDASRSLQLGLLGGVPPSFDGVDVNATYRAGTGALEVGGDWYDAFALPSGAIALVVGDVVGHGVDAAVAMGQLRGAVSALARSSEPAALLEQLDEFVENVPSALAATLAYAELAPDGGLRYACAGHPPPLVVSADGATRFLWDGRSAPLGSVLGGPRTEARDRLCEGETILLYTDGLVERRDEALDAGLGRLVRAATLHAGARDALGQDLIDTLLAGRAQEDDVCLLAARRVPSYPAFRHAFTASPRELQPLRNRLEAWLGRNGVGSETTWGAVLAVSEAAANAIEHGYGSDGVGVVTVSARLREGVLLLTVRDEGGWRDRHAREDRGRGLPIMESVVDELAVERSGDGTLVRMTRAAAG